MTCILLADDERDLVWAVQHSLRNDGYQVLTAYDGAEALALARRRLPDLIILDIVMPGLDGLQVCRELRQDPTLGAIPILFLTVRSSIEDRIAGLDEGGNDYLAKPFDLGELKARIRALLRRHHSAASVERDTEGADSLLSAGGLTLDLKACQIRVAGRTEQLTPTEFDLFYYLMTHPGEVFSSRQLVQRVWGYAPQTADPSLVRWHVKNLRAKIEPDPEHPVYIRYIPRHGYLLTA
ncbi:MAG: response regulator transcription factor [Anaerolineae bacterium]|nr:response regulator transcription factor [Anaerolineae bacterium]